MREVVGNLHMPFIKSRTGSTPSLTNRIFLCLCKMITITVVIFDSAENIALDARVYACENSLNIYLFSTRCKEESRPLFVVA
jgi:hypothetical protein